MKQRAKHFATSAHHGQRRKSSNAPYITHPVRVAERLEAAGFGEELICAGYLHDVVEDTPYTIEDIKEHFGSHVAYLVAAHTEDKSLRWKERKQHTIDTVRVGGKEIKQLIIADKLDNLLSLEADLANQGDAVWDHFNAPYDQQKWYNQAIAKVMYNGINQEDIPDYFKTYEELVHRIFVS
ncbi:HD domain-containing protein [Virgibacillus salexigens]|uniref:HD domain-containing protein n=1 Tax=Virgibacillus salexigens TaxID=61016 RepID=UPI00190A1454|nr:HD domain-containing protein [Virgibacillus salexigens]